MTKNIVFSFVVKNAVRLLIIVGLMVGSVPLFPQTVRATGCDTKFYSDNNILFYNECEKDTCSTSSSNSVLGNVNYAGAQVFSTAQMQSIESNRPFYEKSADAQGIPWQLLAAMHGRETGFNRTGPANGYGPYQITPSSYPIKTTYTDEEFQSATDAAAAFMKGKAGGRDLSDDNNIKFVFFAYNGAAQVYKNQAITLGFSAEEAANGEGSPYVMNRFDERRDPTVEPTKSNGTWGQIKQDYGSIEYPANTDFGAFVYYKALTGGASCDTSASAQNGDPNAIISEFTEYMKSHSERYGAYSLGSNGCTTLAAWYIGEHTTLTYGHGNGREVVSQLVDANPGRGLVITDKPVAPSLFSVAGGVKSWDGSGGPYGHVGLVVSVNEQTGKAIVVDTWDDFAGDTVKANTKEFSFPASGVSFVYLGDNLK